jgi:Domain of unknown function (DUF6306)
VGIETEELTHFLNELLEAERAGARVTLVWAATEGQSQIGVLLRTIHRDESRWCAMLHRHIELLGGDPSRHVGAFYGKTMAIAATRERLTFLNRGQSWVVRKLRDILPRIDDVPLRTEIFQMWRAHKSNINLAVEALNRP